MGIHCEIAEAPTQSSADTRAGAYVFRTNVFTPTPFFNPGRLEEIDIVHGRNNRLDIIGPNHAKLTLFPDNEEFLPGKPKWTQALRRRCRVYATVGATNVEYNLFNGFIDDLDFVYMNLNKLNPRIRLVLIDILGLLGTVQFSESQSAHQPSNTGTRFAQVLADAGVPTSLVDVSGCVKPCGADSSPPTGRIPEYLQQVQWTEGGRIKVQHIEPGDKITLTPGEGKQGRSAITLVEDATVKLGEVPCVNMIPGKLTDTLVNVVNYYIRGENEPFLTESDTDSITLYGRREFKLTGLWDLSGELSSDIPTRFASGTLPADIQDVCVTIGELPQYKLEGVSQGAGGFVFGEGLPDYIPEMVWRGRGNTDLWILLDVSFNLDSGYLYLELLDEDGNTLGTPYKLEREPVRQQGGRGGTTGVTNFNGNSYATWSVRLPDSPFTVGGRVCIKLWEDFDAGSGVNQLFVGRVRGECPVVGVWDVDCYDEKLRDDYFSRSIPTRWLDASDNGNRFVLNPPTSDTAVFSSSDTIARWYLFGRPTWWGEEEDSWETAGESLPGRFLTFLAILAGETTSGSLLEEPSFWIQIGLSILPGVNVLGKAILASRTAATVAATTQAAADIAGAQAILNSVLSGPAYAGTSIGATVVEHLVGQANTIAAALSAQSAAAAAAATGVSVASVQLAAVVAFTQAIGNTINQQVQNFVAAIDRGDLVQKSRAGNPNDYRKALQLAADWLSQGYEPTGVNVPTNGSVYSRRDIIATARRNNWEGIENLTPRELLVLASFTPNHGNPGLALSVDDKKMGTITSGVWGAGVKLSDSTYTDDQVGEMQKALLVWLMWAGGAEEVEPNTLRLRVKESWQGAGVGSLVIDTAVTPLNTADGVPIIVTNERREFGDGFWGERDDADRGIVRVYFDSRKVKQKFDSGTVDPDADTISWTTLFTDLYITKGRGDWEEGWRRPLLNWPGFPSGSITGIGDVSPTNPSGLYGITYGWRAMRGHPSLGRDWLSDGAIGLYFGPTSGGHPLGGDLMGIPSSGTIRLTFSDFNTPSRRSQSWLLFPARSVISGPGSGSPRRYRIWPTTAAGTIARPPWLVNLSRYYVTVEHTSTDLRPVTGTGLEDPSDYFTLNDAAGNSVDINSMSVFGLDGTGEPENPDVAWVVVIDYDKARVPDRITLLDGFLDKIDTTIDDGDLSWVNMPIPYPSDSLNPGQELARRQQAIADLKEQLSQSYALLNANPTDKWKTAVVKMSAVNDRQKVDILGLDIFDVVEVEGEIVDGENLEVVSFVNSIRHEYEGDNWKTTIGLETSTGFTAPLPDINRTGSHPLARTGSQFTLNKSFLNSLDTLG